jgi:exopolysaccharide biosynthesis polyprenyl glycosylphosphotransferase
MAVALPSVVSANLALPRSLPTAFDDSARHDPEFAERLVILALIVDTLVVVASLLFSFWLRFDTFLHDFGVLGRLAMSDYVNYIALGALSQVFVLSYFQVYEKQSLLRFRYVWAKILKAGLYWCAGYLLITLVLKTNPPVSRLFVVIGGVNILAGLLCWRWLFHTYLQRSQVADNLRQRILFVGWNEDADRLSKGFAQDQTHAYEVIGCVPSARGRFQRKPPGSLPVIGQFQDIIQKLHQHRIDMVILSDVNCVKGEIVSLANLCEREMVQFKIIPSYFQILVSGLQLETVSGIPVLGVSQLPLDRFFNTLLKRLVDILGSIFGLLFSAPLIAIFGTLVYLESPGPIFYRQKRLGRNGTLFNIIKIRSMRLDAEANNKPGWTTKDDPRRLRIGGFMRKWNIDEIPQFWNVLKGEMSLVGPRPERPELIQSFKHDIPHYNARHNVKPGITGWAQVKGLRGDTDLTERINSDLYYLENWNLSLDLQIMIMTFFRRKNAC